MICIVCTFQLRVMLFYLYFFISWDIWRQISFQPIIKYYIHVKEHMHGHSQLCFPYNYGICYYDTYCGKVKKKTTGTVFLHFFLNAVKTILNRPDILMTDNYVIITHIHVIPNVSGYVCNHGSPSGERDTASPRGRYGERPQRDSV